MYVSHVIWWGFVAYSVLMAGFMIWFAMKVQEEGG